MIFAYLYKMVIFMVLTGLAVCVALCYWWVRAVGSLFDWLEKKKSGTDVNNPYIRTHLSKIKNDKKYQEYLKWLDQNGGDMPVEKLRTREEFEFEKKLQKAQSEHEIRTMFKGGL